MTAQAQRVLASTARRGAGIMREAAYLATVLRAIEQGPFAPGALELFRARQVFTPGWSSRSLSPQRLVVELRPALAAQEPWQTTWPTLVAPKSEPWRTGR